MEVTIEKLDHYGRGITRINDKICFVDNALPTEIVEIKNLEEKKKYFQAETEKIIKPSINRITPICPFAKECGGCQLLHMDFASENKWKEQKIKEIMKKFANISELSGGQQQKVAIARALASKPAIILADEPTGNLDAKSSKEVVEQLKFSQQRYHQTVVLVTHDDLIASKADRIITIEDGMIISDYNNKK